MTVLHEDEIIPQVLRRLGDDDFIFQFDTAASVEHDYSIKSLHYINELERRKLFLEMGYSSVFDYCTRRMKDSSSAAGRRIQAARCTRRYPEVFAYLRAKELCINTLAFIEPVLTDENKDSILERIRGASRREVERIASEYRAPVVLRDRFRFVTVPGPAPREMEAALFERHCACLADAPVWKERMQDEQKVYAQFLTDEEALDLFDEVRTLLSGRGDLSFSDVFKIVFREYRDRHSPAARSARREAKSGAKSPDSHRWECESTQSRHVPDDVKDDIFVRDGGQCSFVAADGTRCRCRRGLQIDHIKPFSTGGTHDPSNLRLLCGAHNRLAAEKAMGRHVMQPYWRRQ